jgi:glycosyltransferase involved in cell wall biosynthesis
MSGVDILLAAATAHLPQVIGGVEINTHELAIALNLRRRRTAVLARLSPRDAFGARRLVSMRLRGSGISFDTALGYDVYRSRKPWRDLEGMPMPQVVVIQNGKMFEMASTFARRGVPSVAYFHGLPFETGKEHWAEQASSLPFRAYIANSNFTAARLHARYGIDAHVIPPIFRPEHYRASGERRFVTFINPVAPKGVDLALAIAACCPDIPFRFVKGWPLAARELIRLKSAARRLGNVELVERSRDMQAIYGATRVLIVPSQWSEETWGRVASEAQFSGIPIVASDVGGLPEAVGPGGTILAPGAPAQLWADEVRRLWSDAAYYAEKSAAALLHSQRGAIDLDRQIDAFLAIIEKVAA